MTFKSSIICDTKAVRLVDGYQCFGEIIAPFFGVMFTSIFQCFGEIIAPLFGVTFTFIFQCFGEIIAPFFGVTFTFIFQCFGEIIDPFFGVMFTFIFLIYFILISHLPHFVFTSENIPRLASAGATVNFRGSLFFFSQGLTPYTKERANSLTLNATTHIKHVHGDTKPYSIICLDYSQVLHHVKVNLSWRN
jgi:hypothetical protein